MATYFHFAPAVALAVAAGTRTVGWRLMLLGAVCAVLPDADFLLVWLRFDPYSGTYGHRGFTHSLGFALVMGLIAALWHRPAPYSWRQRGLAGLYLALCTASHPLLDGLLDAGICNAWLWPLDGTRHCLGWRPIPMQHVALWGWVRLGTEMLWIGVPLVLLANGGMALRAMHRRWRAPIRPVSQPAATGVKSVGFGIRPNLPDVREPRFSRERRETNRRLQRRRRVEAMDWLGRELRARRISQGAGAALDE